VPQVVPSDPQVAFGRAVVTVEQSGAVRFNRETPPIERPMMSRAKYQAVSRMICPAILNLKYGFS
jgi:hypothetical protein